MMSIFHHHTHEVTMLENFGDIFIQDLDEQSINLEAGGTLSLSCLDENSKAYTFGTIDPIHNGFIIRCVHAKGRFHIVHTSRVAITIGIAIYWLQTIINNGKIHPSDK